ncbi:MAG: adenosylcobinamide-GDP ribazoletransferase [Crocinitomicaceae bacterium]|nr:adenosylcobinamide-GDP ribazoletransferase [Crocinitomicaceae bacterium]
MSRFIAVTFLFIHDYARPKNDSKSKSVAQRLRPNALLTSLFFALTPLSIYVYCTNEYWHLLIPLFLYGVKIILGSYFNKCINGYTGDTLGATQQITEVFYFVGTLVVWKFI